MFRLLYLIMMALAAVSCSQTTTTDQIPSAGIQQPKKSSKYASFAAFESKAAIGAEAQQLLSETEALAEYCVELAAEHRNFRKQSSANFRGLSPAQIQGASWGYKYRADSVKKLLKSFDERKASIETTLKSDAKQSFLVAYADRKSRCEAVLTSMQKLDEETSKEKIRERITREKRGW